MGVKICDPFFAFLATSKYLRQAEWGAPRPKRTWQTCPYLPRILVPKLRVYAKLFKFKVQV